MDVKDLACPFRMVNYNPMCKDDSFIREPNYYTCLFYVCALFDEDNFCCSLNARSRMNVKEEKIEW